MGVEVYPRFVLITKDGEKKVDQFSDDDLIEQFQAMLKEGGVNEIEALRNEIKARLAIRREREWLQESVWVYQEQAQKVIEVLTTNLKAHFGESCRVWQNEDHVKGGKYPHYLCSADLKGYGGDTCHMWRDGQTYWPMVGDYSLDEMEKAELILRKSILEFQKRG